LRIVANQLQKLKKYDDNAGRAASLLLPHQTPADPNDDGERICAFDRL
jgi:hypothetical protein